MPMLLEINELLKSREGTIPTKWSIAQRRDIKRTLERYPHDLILREWALELARAVVLHEKKAFRALLAEEGVGL